MHFLERAHKLVIWFWFPAGVVAAVLRFKPGQPTDGRNQAGCQLLAGHNGTPLAGHHLDHIPVGFDGREIRGSLDQTGNIGAHGKNSVWHAGEEIHSIFGVCGVQHLSGALGFVGRNLKSGIEGTQFGFVGSLGSSDKRFQFALARGWAYHHGYSFAGDGVVSAATIYLRQLDLQVLQQFLKGSAHYL